MPVSKVKALMVQKKFIAQYYDPAYIKKCEVSLVGVCDGKVVGDERQDYCLVVTLRTTPSFKIPKELDGVRVYVRIGTEDKPFHS